MPIDYPDEYVQGANPVEVYDFHTMLPIAANTWALRNGLLFNLPVGILRRVLVYMTPGCMNRVRTNLFQGSQQILPFVNLVPFVCYDFTKVDALARIACTSTAGLSVVFTGMLNNDTSYMYKDYGTGSFDAWEARANIKITAAANASRVHVLSFWNSIGPMAGLGSLSHLSTYLYYNGVNYQIILYYVTSGGVAVTTSYNIAINTDYYIKMRHTTGDTHVYLDIYSDSTYTTLLTTINITHAELGTNYYRYFYPIQSYSGGAGVAMSGYVKYVYLNAPSVTFITGEDYWYDTHDFFQYIPHFGAGFHFKRPDDVVAVYEAGGLQLDVL